MDVLLGLIRGGCKKGLFLLLFQVISHWKSKARRRNPRGRAAFAAFPPCSSKAGDALGRRFPFPALSRSWDFSSRQLRAGRPLAGSWAETSQAGRTSDPVSSTETFQPSAFGKAWVVKPRLGKHQLEVKIIIFTQEMPGVLFFKFFLSYFPAQR